MKASAPGQRTVAFAPHPGKQALIFTTSADQILAGGGKKSGKALTPDHDVLTDRGWVPIGDIKRGDMVAGLKQEHAQDRGQLVYARVDGVFTQDHNGKVLSSKYRPYFKASPEHRWLVSEPERKPPRTADNWHYITSETMGSGSKGVLRIPVTGEPLERPPTRRWSDDEMQLWGWYIAEGCGYKVSGSITGSDFSQYKPDGLAAIEQLLRSVGAAVRKYNGGIKTDWMPPIFCGSDCYSKFIPRDAMAQPNAWKLIEGFIAGDGENDRGGFIAATASRQLADDIQEVCLLAGWRCTIAPKPNKYVNSTRVIANGKGRIKNAQNWRLHIRARRWVMLSQKYLSWEHYRGKTHCLFVPHTSNFIARRNGSPFVTGNTACAIARPLLHINDSRFRCVVLRKTTPGLKYIESQARKLYHKVCPDVEHNRTQHLFTFPSGAQILFTFAETLDDCEKLEGWGYQMLIVDEARQFPDPLLIDTLAAELYAENDPSTGTPWMRPLLLLLSNPGGRGGEWLRERFAIDKFPKGGQELYDEETKRYRIYIHMTVHDNPSMDSDSYIAGLRIYPVWKQKQMINGDWFQKEGAAFEEFDANIHVIPSFDTEHCEIHRSCDWGYATACAIHYWAVHPDANYTVCVDELTFSRVKPRDVARACLKLEEQRGYDVVQGVIGHDAGGDDTSGLSPHASMADEGVYFRKVKYMREDGYRAMVARLSTMIELQDGSLVPSVRFVEDRCPRLWQSIGTLPQKIGEDDVDKAECKKANGGKGNDHHFDSCKYHLCSLPLPERQPRSVERFRGVPDDDSGRERAASHSNQGMRGF